MNINLYFYKLLVVQTYYWGLWVTFIKLLVHCEVISSHSVSLLFVVRLHWFSHMLCIPMCAGYYTCHRQEAYKCTYMLFALMGSKDNVLTFSQLPQLMSDPVTSWGLWPASQCQTPGPADGRQQSEGSTLRTSGLAILAWKAVVITVKVTEIDHQERSHQDCFQHLQRQITQLLQQQHHLRLDFCNRAYWTNMLFTEQWASNDLFTNFIWQHSIIWFNKNSSGDEIANVNFLRRHRTDRGQFLRPLNRLPNYYRFRDSLR